MADTPTTPTVTPDAATTAPNIQDNSAPPLMPVNQSNPQPAPPPAASQPPAQAAQSAPAAAAATTKPSSNVWRNVIEGVLGGLAKTGKVLGQGALAVGKSTRVGQNLQANAIARQAEKQKMDLAQQENQRAQQENQRAQQAEQRQEALFPGVQEEQKLRLNQLSTQNVGLAIKNGVDRSNATITEQENDMKKNRMDAELLKIFKDQGYPLQEEHGHTFDNLGKPHAQDMVSGKVFALNNGLTGENHGIVIGNTVEAQQTPLLKDANDVADGWTLDPKTGSMTQHTSSFAADGHHTIYDLLMAKYNNDQEFAEKNEQAKAIIQNRETAGGGGTTKALIKFEQDPPSEMAGDKAQAAISAAQTALNDPNITPDLKSRWQRILEMATSTQKLTEDQKSREQQRAAEIQAGGQNAIDDQAEQLVNGDMDPTQMTKRSSAYNQVLKAADDYSVKTTGKRFDLAQAQSDYKFATTPATQNTLKYLNSVIPNMDDLVKQSNTIGRTQLPALNNAAAWARVQTGDPKMAAYNATITEVSDQIAKILQGGGTGNGTSDAKLKQAQELFNVGFTPQQVVATVGELQKLLGTRKDAIIGDNRYLKKQYGVSTHIPSTQNTQQSVKIGGQSYPRNPDGTVTVSGHNYKIGSDGKTLNLVSAGASGSF